MKIVKTCNPLKKRFYDKLMKNTLALSLNEINRNVKLKISRFMQSNIAFQKAMKV